MDIFDETKAGLKKIWDDEFSRQQAKIVLIKAIGEVSEITVKIANDIMGELDNLLLEEKEDSENTRDQSL